MLYLLTYVVLVVCDKVNKFFFKNDFKDTISQLVSVVKFQLVLSWKFILQPFCNPCIGCFKPLDVIICMRVPVIEFLYFRFWKFRIVWIDVVLTKFSIHPTPTFLKLSIPTSYCTLPHWDHFESQLPSTKKVCIFISIYIFHLVCGVFNKHNPYFRAKR